MSITFLFNAMSRTPEIFALPFPALHPFHCGIYSCCGCVFFTDVEGHWIVAETSVSNYLLGWCALYCELHVHAHLHILMAQHTLCVSSAEDSFPGHMGTKLWLSVPVHQTTAALFVSDSAEVVEPQEGLQQHATFCCDG